MLVSAAASGLPGDRRYTTAHSLVGLFCFVRVFVSVLGLLFQGHGSCADAMCPPRVFA